MAIGISNEWFDKLTVLTRDFFETCKMKSFPSHLQYVEPCAKFLNTNSNLFDAIPAFTQKMLTENNWLYDNMSNSNYVTIDHETQKVPHNSILFPNIFSAIDEKLLLSSRIISKSLDNPFQNTFTITEKFCSNKVLTSMLNKSDKISLEVELPKDFMQDPASCTVNDLQFFNTNSASSDKVEQASIMQASDSKSKSCSGMDFSDQLVMRKTKELKRHSKKRRRRQKKKMQVTDNNAITENKKSETKPERIQTAKDIKPIRSKLEKLLVYAVEDEVDCPQILAGSPSRVSVQDSKSSEIMCVSFEDFKSGLELNFCDPIIASSDEDSDWDTCSGDRSLIEAEFEYSGMFFASFSTFCEVDLTFKDPGTTCSIFQDICETTTALREVNRLWHETYKDTGINPKHPTKVSFVPDDKLVTTVYIEDYDRKSEWEVLATERLRFKRRIDDLESVISPCLTEKHRIKITERNIKLTL